MTDNILGQREYKNFPVLKIVFLMLMTGLSWLTDELWRGHYMADIQLPSYSYMFSIYTNNNKKLFHRGAQNQIYEEGHTIWYNAFMNIVSLQTKRITTGNKEQTLLEYSNSGILEYCIKKLIIPWEPLQHHLLPYDMDIYLHVILPFPRITSAFHWYKCK